MTGRPYSLSHALKWPLLGLIVIPALLADTELNIAGYRIIWHDEFEAEAVDASKWEVNIGVNASYQRASDGRFVEPHWFGDAYSPWLQVNPINDERQYYSPDNVSVVDGVLEIRADRESVANPVGWYQPGYHAYTSGKLNTADEFQFRFGIVRWSAQLPGGRGLWPALWMLNAPDPWFWDDEIDIMEAKGSLPTHMSSAHHFKVFDGQGNRQNRFNTAEVDTGINLQTSFNEYTLLWEPTFLQTWVNRQEVFFDAEAVPQDPMFLIMNAAVGGMFDGLPTAENVFPTYFKIDWVRVWQPASTPGDLASGGFEEFQGRQWANWNTRDDGNLSVFTSAPLHGAASVEIGFRQTSVEEGEPPANWFIDGTASGWNGYLNLLSAADELLSGSPEDPANIPATLGDSTAVLPIHQTAPAARANAVIYRQISGPFLGGREVIFSGQVAIEEAFPAGASAIAFIRIFNDDFSFTDVAATVTNGGGFSLQTQIAQSGVPFLQIGLETTGNTGSQGRLRASELSFTESNPPPPIVETGTGFLQTMIVSAGQTVRYGVLAANHMENPLNAGAEGRLTIEFLNAEEVAIDTQATVVVAAGQDGAIRPFAMQTTAPAGTASARLRIERVTLDPAIDASGSFIADAAFLQIPDATELPQFPALPIDGQTVNAGEAAALGIEVSSPTPVTYSWYRNGVFMGSSDVLELATTPDSGGEYFLVAANAAGPVISNSFELTILDPDSDGDGFSDYSEVNITKTDPNDPQSALRVTAFSFEDGQLALAFASVSGVRYQAFTSTDLIEWDPINTPLTADAALTQITTGLAAASEQPRFFRIEVIP